MMRPMRQKWLLVLVAILFLTNIATLAIIWVKKPSKNQQANDPGKKDKKMGQFMIDQLKFDTVQAAAYRQLRDSLVTQQRPVMDSMRTAKLRYYDLLNQPDVNDSMLHARSNEVADLQKKLDLITFRHFQQVRSLCRPDQLQKLDTVVKEIVNRMTPYRRNRQNDSTNRK
jgi:periplasmic protein CpxP/Spy